VSRAVIIHMDEKRSSEWNDRLRFAVRGLCCESEDKQYRATSEWSRSMKSIKFVGLDVHAETIAGAVAEQGGEVRSLGVIPNREESIRKLVKRLGPVEQLRFCYEAGPTA
jgi:hypothetical protein